MDVREKLIEILENSFEKQYEKLGLLTASHTASDLIANGVTVRECGEWVHPKGYVVSNDFLCSKCGHKEVSHYPINPRLGGGYIADENGNFFYPPKLNYCPNCGARMDGGDGNNAMV